MKRFAHPRWVAVILVVLLAGSLGFAADTPNQKNAKFTYQAAPKVIHDVLGSRPTPQLLLAPTRDRALAVEVLRQPPLSDLAQPMLRIAGLRINPATNGPHHPLHVVGLSVVTIEGGKSAKVALPPNPWISGPQWSADGKHFAFLRYLPAGIELWVGEAATATAHAIGGVKVNAAYREPFNWMGDNKTLLVQTVPAGRGKAPEEARVPAGPNVQESAGKVAPIPTYEDLLKDRHDEDLFDYYCTGQLNYVDVATGKATPVGKPGIFDQIDPSPDDKHILVARLHKPYSYLIPAGEFPRTVEVWDRAGKVERQVADLPSHEGVPLEGVLTGPRNVGWRPTAAATLVWAESLDGGNTRAKVPYHDRVVALAAPFQGEPVELTKVEFRLMSRGAGVG